MANTKAFKVKNGLVLSSYDTSNSDTAVDVFVYDTSKDSDGGAWRHRTQNTSWYNETLNTSTRGSRREFPAVALIVAEATQLTIYDADDPNCPMWMVFDSGGSNGQYMAGRASESTTCVAAFNGQMEIGRNSFGLHEVFFIEDRGFFREKGNVNDYLLPIVDRNGTNIWGPNQSPDGDLVNDIVLGVALTALPNAPINPASGLPTPTVAVGCDQGVSVILPDGRVPTITHTASTHSDAKHMDFVGNTIAYSSQQSGSSTNFWRRCFIDVIPYSVSGSYLQNVPNLVAFDARGNVGHKPPLNVHFDLGNATNDIKGAASDKAVAFTNKLTLINRGPEPDANQPNPSESASVAYIATDYNTGWMPGNTNSCVISDTTTGTIDFSDLLNGAGDFADASEWSGGSTWSISGGTATADGTSAYLTPVSNGFLTAEKQYTATITVTSYTSGTLYIYMGTGAPGGNYYANTPSATGTFTFVLSAYNSNFGIYSANFVGTIDNVTVEEVVQDRSYQQNGAIVRGSLTAAAVDTNCDLVSYTGWSTSNYLEIPYESGYNYDSSMMIMFWVKDWSSGSSLLHRGPSTTRNSKTSFLLYNDAGYDYRFAISNDGTTEYNTEIELGNDLAGWQHVCFSFEKPVVKGFLNGELKVVNDGNNFDIFSQATDENSIYIGIGPIGSSDSDMKLALLRMGITPIADSEVRRIYEDEKKLFGKGGKAVLYGSSDSVTDVAYDPETDLVHAGTSSGRSVFQKLNRIDNTTDAVATAISAVNNLVADE